MTITDLGTKTGTTVDGHKYKDEKYVITESSVEIKMGGCPDLFRYEGPFHCMTPLLTMH